MTTQSRNLRLSGCCLRLLLIIACLLVISCREEPGPAALYDIRGNPISLTDRNNTHWQILNYWAVWCKPCREEIPQLNELAERYPHELRVMGINFDQRQGDELLRESQTMGITFIQLSEDPGPTLGLERPESLPTTVILTPQGKLHTMLRGPQTIDSLLAALPGEALHE